MAFFVLKSNSMIPLLDGEGGVAVRGFRISYIRLLVITLLAIACGFLSYQAVRPEVFYYIKVKEQSELEMGTPLSLDHIEKGVLEMGNRFFSSSVEVPGFIPWKEASNLIGLPVTRHVKAGGPLLMGDIPISTEESQIQINKPNQTALTIPVDNISGVSAQLQERERVHIYASFKDDEGAHTGLLLKAMPVVSVQRGVDGDGAVLKAVTISLTLHEARLLTHALHYGKLHLGKAGYGKDQISGIGDIHFATAMMKSNKRWTDMEGEGGS
ncbi:hypothetical protein [Brevibacillus laterosporus]|uniref:hypothetical protein n=1 Tax=Brevibacillus laterosporus TaxID=1465 RepID=UPI003D24CDD0